MLVDDAVAVRGSPVNQAAAETPPEPGIGLCLSGGGYRAMLFHLGVLWRLYETGLLLDPQLKRISSVSGGSITSAALALAWPRLQAGGGAPELFVETVVKPIRRLADTSIDVGAVIGGILLPGNAADRVAAAYRDLLDNATLQDLPDHPRFVFNATNVQSGALWRFSKPYMGDYRVGRVFNPTFPLRLAVAASSAFPPVLSPLTFELPAGAVRRDETGGDLNAPPFTTRVVLSDGGVYDNLGLETVWKRYDTVLVSDAGAKIAPEPKPHVDWARHAYRVLDLVDNQVRSLRKRQLIGSYMENKRNGAYWSIRGNIDHYGGALPGMPCPVARTMDLAAEPTRLTAIPAARQERLINWGYAICAAALNQHFPKPGPAAKFPYEAGV